MQSIKKALKLSVFIIIMTLASIGLGINAAILPSFNRENAYKPTIEMVESRDEESETEGESHKQ